MTRNSVSDTWPPDLAKCSMQLSILRVVLNPAGHVAFACAGHVAFASADHVAFASADHVAIVLVVAPRPLDKDLYDLRTRARARGYQLGVEAIHKRLGVAVPQDILRLDDPVANLDFVERVAIVPLRHRACLADLGDARRSGFVRGVQL